MEVRVMGDQVSAARVAATCGVSARELPAGARWIEASPAAGAPCEVGLEPVGVGDAGSRPARWLAVEVLAFRAR